MIKPAEISRFICNDKNDESDEIVIVFTELQRFIGFTVFIKYAVLDKSYYITYPPNSIGVLSKGENAVRTLKIFFIAASLFLFVTSATAANYPPEMPDIQNAPVQFVCETPSSLFIKTYLNLNEKWRVIITGRNAQEMLMDIISKDRRNIFALIPSINEWKNIHNLSEKEGEELKKFLGSAPTKEDSRMLQSCVKSNMRSLGLPQ